MKPSTRESLALGQGLAKTSPPSRPAFGDVYVAVALPRGVTTGRAVRALLAVTADGKHKLVVERSTLEGTVPQAVAWALLAALDRLDGLGRSGILHTNFQAATASGYLGLPEGETFAGLMATVARRCEESGSALARCPSTDDPMPRVMAAAQAALKELA